MGTTVDLGYRASGTEIGDYCIIGGHVGAPRDPSLHSLLTASPEHLLPIAYDAFQLSVCVVMLLRCCCHVGLSFSEPSEPRSAQPFETPGSEPSSLDF